MGFAESNVVGIDLGSTTAKLVLSDFEKNIKYSIYKRHCSLPLLVIQDLLRELKAEYGNIDIKVAMTGSVAQNLAKWCDFTYIQEVIASNGYLAQKFPEANSFIEIGGEDSKIILKADGQSDIRMNTECAGGTGAFIDQMCELLQVSPVELNYLAKSYKNLYPVSARCGVYAKTDLQTLLSRGVSQSDVAASVFNAIALQVISSLSRGRVIKPPVVMAGGPLYHYDSLRDHFISILNLDTNDVIVPDSALFVPALGASYQLNGVDPIISIEDFIQNLNLRNANSNENKISSATILSPPAENIVNVLFPRVNGEKPNVDNRFYIGIDSGSTTMKIVALDREHLFVGSWYQKVVGTPLDTFKDAFKEIDSVLRKRSVDYEIYSIAVTGYGSEMLTMLPGTVMGPVETVAHLKAAQWLKKDTNIVIDVGGQDIKAISLQNGAVNIEINDACSSGCATFVETFSATIGIDRAKLDQFALKSELSYPLGTRCTVFMNSKIKEAIRDEAPVEHIAAGLIDSVAENICKKLVHNTDFPADGSIMLHGGGMRYGSLVNRVSVRLNRKVHVPEFPELMGAVGAALALFHLDDQILVGDLKNRLLKFDFDNYTEKSVLCRACNYNCNVIARKYENGRTYYTGNRCETVFSNTRNGKKDKTWLNYNFLKQKELLHSVRGEDGSKTGTIRIGIPLVLHMHDEFPFWSTFLEECGFEVVKSDSDCHNQNGQFVVADDLCQPGRSVYYHVIDLIEKGVDRILLPASRYGFCSNKDDDLRYHCPIITGIPDSVRSLISPYEKYGIHLDSPEVQFKNLRRLEEYLVDYFLPLTGSAVKVRLAVLKGIVRYNNVRSFLFGKVKELRSLSTESEKPFVLLLGRPYIYDSKNVGSLLEWLGHQGIPILTEDVSMLLDPQKKDNSSIENRWIFTDRIMDAVNWIPPNSKAIVVHLQAFGCGPDASIADSIANICKLKNIPVVSLKLDGTGFESIRLRIRSSIEAMSLGLSDLENGKSLFARRKNAEFDPTKVKTVLAPYINYNYQKLLPVVFRSLGIHLKILPVTNKKSEDYGVSFVNNDMCFPSILVAGDIIQGIEDARQEGYDSLAVLVTETGGQCRASTYSNVVKQALLKRGFEDVPVMTFATLHSTGSARQALKFTRRLINGLIIVDYLNTMYSSSKAVEMKEGESYRILHHHIDMLEEYIEENDWKGMLRVLSLALEKFNGIEVNEIKPIPVGIVGEIYVKYNEYANRNLTGFLENENREIVIPPMYSFFFEAFINNTYNESIGLERELFLNKVVNRYIEKIIQGKIQAARKVMNGYCRNRDFPDYRILSELRNNVVSLINQYGEGWILVADIMALFNKGIKDIICVQPFGCISNHMMGKGMEKKLVDMMPGLNLQFIDYDHSLSDANIRNRLNLFLQKSDISGTTV